MESTPPDRPSPTFVLGQIIFELHHAALLVSQELATLSPKESPTTYQTLRWLGGALVTCEKAVADVSKAAGLHEREQYQSLPTFVFLQIPFILADAEKRMWDALESFDLNNLPPGNPGEEEFEKLLKPKMALNKAAAMAGKHLGELNNALSSPTYKLDSTEADRVLAWREQRRAKCRETITAITEQETELKKALDQLAEAKRGVSKDLEDTDQMTFAEFDPSKPLVMGDEEEPEHNEAAP